MSEKDYEKSFLKRSTICFFLVITFFFTCILRLSVIAVSDYAQVQTKQASLRITAGVARGTIFDCNMKPLSNAKEKTIACLTPTPRTITAIGTLLPQDELNKALEMLKNKKPCLFEVEKQIECDGISYAKIYEHNSAETPAIHLLGYTDSDNHGISGLEKAYDDILYSDKNIDFVYTADGLGNILKGIEPSVSNDDFPMSNGVITTLDSNIQAIVEDCCEKLPKGCVIVSDCESGKIRAMASRPTFNCTEIEKYLTDKDSPLLNRATLAYNVGSVFKLCVAAAGLENGIHSFTYNCKGNLQIGNRLFNCHKREGHGVLNLNGAVAFSCNTFFYSFANQIGGEKIYDIASSLQFGRSIELCDGISTAAGNLPKKDTLLNGGNLANFSIGQGQLLLSPIAMLNLYNCIANGGEYTSPSLVEATLKNGIREKVATFAPTKVMSEKNAETLKNALIEVVESGTANEAKPLLTTAAGKTSTAQTGKFHNGKEIDRGWFCGFFPAENPRYTVIVFSENVAESEYSCAQIFAEIADRICEAEA